MFVILRRCSRTPAFSRGYASGPPSDTALPPFNSDAWRKAFPWIFGGRRDRVSIGNPDTARIVAKAVLNAAPPSNAGGKVVLEAFPGPGVLSRALLEHPSSSLKKLIILEEDEGYLEYLRPLQDADPRVTVVPLSGHQWATYSDIDSEGLLRDVEATPWDASIPNLHFVSHLPQTIHGEQLIAQLFRSIPERSWLFKYGRVPMSILMSDLVWSRVTGQIGTSKRGKLSVIAEATSEVTESVEPDKLAPYSDHFHPPIGLRKGNKSPGQPMHVATVVPYAEQIIQKGMTDQWDYVLRRLFVLKSTPLKGAMDSLAPGSRTLLQSLTDTALPRTERVNITKRPRDLNVAEWALILRAFDRWPFKPADLLIDAFMHDD